MKNALHIVFGESAAGLLKFVFSKLEIKNNNKVLCFDDCLSIGSLYKVNTIKGLSKRKEYFYKLYSHIGIKYDTLSQSDFAGAILDQIDIKNFDKIVIWSNKNAPELLMTALSCHHLNNSTLFEIDASKIILHNKNIPKAVAECHPDDIEKLLSTEKPIDEKRRDDLKRLWDNAIQSKKLVRIYKDEKIIYTNEDYYDQLIIEKCSNDYKMAQKVIGEVLGSSNQLVGDSFISYRLIKLINNKQVLAKGDIKEIRVLKVKKIVR